MSPRDEAYYFDQEWATEHPLCVDLMTALRPPVRFRITRDYRVVRYDRRGGPPFRADRPTLEWLTPQTPTPGSRSVAFRREQARAVILQAIAHHLENECMAEIVTSIGEWTRIPALIRPRGQEQTPLLWDRAKGEPKDDEYLGELMTRFTSPEQVLDIRKLRLNEKRPWLLNFGIRLWTDDVIVPGILLRPAGDATRVTQAAALRLRRQRPDRVLFGERDQHDLWDAARWSQFERATRARIERTNRDRPGEGA